MVSIADVKQANKKYLAPNPEKICKKLLWQVISRDATACVLPKMLWNENVWTYANLGIGNSTKQIFNLRQHTKKWEQNKTDFQFTSAQMRNSDIALEPFTTALV